MSGLLLEKVGKSFGQVKAVNDVDLQFPQGKFVCLLGPSGCGKTTLLRLIAGLELPTTGRILLDGADLTHTPAHRREFGMVFQSLALFPHLTVGENIAYALAIRGAPKEERRKRAEELLELVRLPGVADRHISQLSGGQRQRLEHHPELPLVRGRVRQIRSVEEDPSRGRKLQPCDQSQQGGLAATGRPQKAHELPLRKLQVDVVHRLDLAERLPDLLEQQS